MRRPVASVISAAVFFIIDTSMAMAGGWVILAPDWFASQGRYVPHRVALESFNTRFLCVSRGVMI